MITYTTSLENLAPDRLRGFFVGWPNPPSPATHLRILRQSACVVLAVDDDSNRVVGFINAISDGIMSAYLPLLEVLPEYQGRGIGGELVQRVLKHYESLYMVDLICDEGLRPFYERHGLTRFFAMGRRDFDHQSGE